MAEFDQKFQGDEKSWDQIYILYKYLGKIIEGTILYIFKNFGRKIENFTLLIETFGGRVHPHFTLSSAIMWKLILTIHLKLVRLFC
ncbi:hypothetical protein Hanom_Chr08g00691451 [Helianthus anomalus]